MGGYGLRYTLGYGFSCYFLSKSSNDRIYFFVYLFICRGLDAGFSGKLGLGLGEEEALSIDLTELFLSKVLGLDAVRGLLKVGI